MLGAQDGQADGRMQTAGAWPRPGGWAGGKDDFERLCTRPAVVQHYRNIHAVHSASLYSATLPRRAVVHHVLKHYRNIRNLALRMARPLYKH